MAKGKENPKETAEFTRLDNLRGLAGATRDRRRIGRGTGSGVGKTSGRGHKGAKSRSGYRKRVGFEGGQMPLQRRLPKRGFRNIFGKEFSEVNVCHLERFEAGAALDADTLRASGVVRKIRKDGVRILGNGTLTKSLHLKVQGCSRPAREKVEKAGGSVVIVPLREPSVEEGS